MPPPSCRSSLTRPPLRPRKQTIPPACGSRPSPCRTWSASVFMPRRMSVTPPAIHPRTPAGNAIICSPGSAGTGPMRPGPPKTGRGGAVRSSEQSRAERRGSAAAAACPSRRSSAPARKQGRSGSRTHRSDTVAARRSAASGRYHAAAMPLMAFLDHPDLVRVAPVTTPRRVLGGQDLDLGCELEVDHNVGLSSPPALHQTAHTGTLQSGCARSMAGTPCLSPSKKCPWTPPPESTTIHMAEARRQLNFHQIRDTTSSTCPVGCSDNVRSVNTGYPFT